MLGRPARSHAGGVALVVVLAATLAAALIGAGATLARAVGPDGPDAQVFPSQLAFNPMEPGETLSQTATLTVDAPQGAALVRAVVSGTGALAGHLTTAVEACAIAWTAQGCGAGGGLLVAGPVGAGIETTLQVPVPSSGVTYLRVSLALDEAAPPSAAGNVAYELHLLAPDEPTVPPPTETAGPAPTQPAGPVPPPSTGSGGVSATDADSAGRLSATGADVAALGAAALALVALGLTLRAWVRERRPAPPGGRP